MPRLTPSRLAALLLTVTLLAGAGCASQNHVDRLNTANRTAEEQIVELKARLEQANAQIRALQEAGQLPSAQVLARIAQLEQERDAAQAALADAENRIRGLVSAENPTALPAELDSALAALAAQNPGIMTYDPDRGMIKFRSDLTFGLGSDQVKQTAASSLGQLAQVIRSPAASGYEVRIVGHTDNVTISRVRAQHPTNWHLSVHRAIAVKDVLQKAGVAPVRMNVSGYGEYRPIAPNGPKGAEANRRVEIFLVSTDQAGGVAGGAAGAPLGAAPRPAKGVAPAGAVAENPARFK